MKVKIGKNSFNVTPCRTFLSYIAGLMFRFPKNNGLIFIFKNERYVSLHTIFVFYPIYILYLNKNKEVTRIKKAMPFTLIISPTKCKYILELKNLKNIKLGQRVKFTDC